MSDFAEERSRPTFRTSELPSRPASTPVAAARVERSRRLPMIVLAGVTLVALVLRWSLFDIQSGDYRAFLQPWFTHLLESGGLPGLADEFSNYNTPYLLLMALLTYLPVDPLVSIKALSVAFDLVMGIFAYKIVRVVRPEARWLPTVVTGAVLLLPTVVMNSSAWGQCDSIYGSFTLASLYFLMTRRPWRASLFFGLAIGFKLQAVFFLPVLVLVLLVNHLKLRTLLAAPVAFFALLTPALIAGRSLASQLAVYPDQITAQNGVGGPTGMGGGGRGGMGGGPGGGGQGGPPIGSGGAGGPGGGGLVFGSSTDPGVGHAYTFNAPTWYAWLPQDASVVWKYLGLGLAAAVGLAFAVWLLRRRRALGPADVLVVAAAVTLVIPLLLPQMHERYFYLGEVLMLIAAIAVDRRLLVPALLIETASTATYLAYLRGANIVPLEVVAVLGVAAVLTTAVLVIRRMRSASAATPTASAVAASVQIRP